MDKLTLPHGEILRVTCPLIWFPKFILASFQKLKVGLDKNTNARQVLTSNGCILIKCLHCGMRFLVLKINK